MNFNHQQKISALGHVVALLTATALGYVSFLGLVYLRQGHIVQCAVTAAVAAALLFILCVRLQKLKGTDSHFHRCIIHERITAMLLLLGCVAFVVPFTHFFTIYGQEREVKTVFTDALSEVKPMWDEYDSLANARIDAYKNYLEKTVSRKSSNRSRYASAGFNRYADGKPGNGDNMMVDNMVSTLRNILLPTGFNSLRGESEAWVSRASLGATTTNVFLLGNAREIRAAVLSWQQMMAEAMAVKLDNEPQQIDTLFVSSHCTAAVSRLDHVAEMCGHRSFPSLLSLVLVFICGLMMFFPYWLQDRHSKSWERLLPGRRGGEAPSAAQQGIELGEGETMHDSEGYQLRKTLAAAVDPYSLLATMMGDGRLSTRRLLSMLRDDHNLIDAVTVKELVDQGVITFRQLTDDCGIDGRFVSMLGSTPIDVLPEADMIQMLPDDTTEVFFWGIPSSGKTCALGVILASLHDHPMIAKTTIDETCQGYGYQLLLRKIFEGNGHYAVLPGRTPVATNYAIRLTLEDHHHQAHPITLVDMAGELFCARLWHQNGRMQQVSDKHRRALAELSKILVTERSEHQKFHVFIIEYGADDKKYKGFDQDTYLEYGLKYLDEQGILRDSTQGLYVLVTKTDEALRHLGQGEDIETHLDRYVRTYYPNFMGMLDKYCYQYELCGGRAPAPIPFDIGEVCFNNYCRINTSRAGEMVSILLTRSKGFRQGWRGKVAGIFNR